VKIQSLENFKKKSSGDADLIEAGNIWKPAVNQSLRVTAAEFKNISQSKKQFVLVDVRDPSEFSDHLPDAINIPWKKFISDKGVPKTTDEIRELLQSKGANPTQSFVLYCETGVKGAYVTFALSQSGIQASNLDGGLKSFRGL
jgi:3-mercaptopyruvate sulfurtransferase SseA